MLPAAPAPAPAAFPGENGRIAFTATRAHLEPCDSSPSGSAYVYDEGIFTMNPDGSDSRQLTDSQTSTCGLCHKCYPGADRDPTFSPNGMWIAFIHQESGSAGREHYVFLMRVSGGDLHEVTHHTAFEPSFSPSGRRIAFASLKGIWIVGTNGGDERRITDEGREPAFFPRSNRIAFTRLADRPLPFGGRLFSIRSDGSDLRRLATRGSEPDVSPDGNPAHLASYGRHASETGHASIVFMKFHSAQSGQRQSSSDIYLMRADGTRKRPLTAAEPGEYNFEPAFSPNGKRIAFTNSHRAGISVMRVDGSHKQAVIPDPLPFGVSDPAEVSLEQPSWGPAP